MPAAVQDAWFNEPVAVLPFSNRTNSVTAPDTLRGMAAGMLRGMGYRTVPLPDIDARLRMKGVTLGDQLVTMSATQLAEAVGARRLVWGGVEEFGVVNVGIYYRRDVRVGFVLRDGNGRELWRCTGEGFREVASDNPGGTFLGGLIGGALERATRSYLKEESEQAVISALLTLPSRPRR